MPEMPPNYIPSDGQSLNPANSRDFNQYPDLREATTIAVNQLNEEIKNTEAQRALASAWGDDTTELDQKLANHKEDLAGHLDMQGYLNGRDTIDGKGKVRDAESGQYKSKEDANKGPEFYPGGDEKPYPDMTMNELIDKWADAEQHQDNTISQDVQDEIIDRLDKESGLSEDHKANLIDTLHNQMLERQRSMSNVAVESGESSQDSSGISEATVSPEPEASNPSHEEAESQDTTLNVLNAISKRISELENMNTSDMSDSEVVANQNELKKLKQLREFYQPLGNENSQESADEEPADQVDKVNSSLVEQERPTFDYEGFARLKTLAERKFARKEDKEAYAAELKRFIEFVIANNMIVETDTKISDSQEVERYDERAAQETLFMKAVEQKIKSIRKAYDEVEQIQARQWNEKHPKLSRLTNFLKTKPKTRVLASAMLAGVGVASAVVGLAPVTAAAAALGSIIGAPGVYITSKNVGGGIASRLLNSRFNNLQDY